MRSRVYLRLAVRVLEFSFKYKPIHIYKRRFSCFCRADVVVVVVVFVVVLLLLLLLFLLFVVVFVVVVVVVVVVIVAVQNFVLISRSRNLWNSRLKNDP